MFFYLLEAPDVRSRYSEGHLGGKVFLVFWLRNIHEVDQEKSQHANPFHGLLVPMSSFF